MKKLKIDFNQVKHARMGYQKYSQHEDPVLFLNVLCSRQFLIE